VRLLAAPLASDHVTDQSFSFLFLALLFLFPFKNFNIRFYFPRYAGLRQDALCWAAICFTAASGLGTGRGGGRAKTRGVGDVGSAACVCTVWQILELLAENHTNKNWGSQTKLSINARCVRREGDLGTIGSTRSVVCLLPCATEDGTTTL
jgi:hypothetical protein